MGHRHQIANRARGVHRSIRELETAIRDYSRVYKLNPRPFVWTKTADARLASVSRALRMRAAHAATGWQARGLRTAHALVDQVLTPVHRAPPGLPRLPPPQSAERWSEASSVQYAQRSSASSPCRTVIPSATGDPMRRLSAFIRIVANTPADLAEKADHARTSTSTGRMRHRALDSHSCARLGNVIPALRPTASPPTRPPLLGRSRLAGTDPLGTDPGPRVHRPCLSQHASQPYSRAVPWLWVDARWVRTHSAPQQPWPRRSKRSAVSAYACHAPRHLSPDATVGKLHQPRALQLPPSPRTVSLNKRPHHAMGIYR